MKSYTNIEQSKLLAEILPIESADMWYWEFPTAPTYNNYGYPMFHKGDGIANVPCWSLAALMSVLPIVNGKQTILRRGNQTGLWYCYYEDEVGTQTYNNPVDACVEMIIKLHEQNML